MVSTKTLKLDMSFRPIEVIDAIEALVLCLVGKAHGLQKTKCILERPKSMSILWK